MAEGNLSAASFCGSPFWDHQVTVNATDPDLTPCFQKTVLVWVPCGFLLLVAPFRIYDLKRNGKGEIPLSCLCVAKLVFGALIGVIALIDIFKCVQEFSSGRFNLLVNLLSPLVLLFTMILADYLLHVERVGGIHSSGVMLVFWWLLFVTGLVTFRSKIKQALSEDRGLEDLFRFITFFLYYPLVLVQLMLSAFVDKPFHLAEVHHAANPCPEESASFLSRITFWWCTSIIIKGYKKPLVKEDLWSLNQDLASAAFVPKFYKHWEKQKTKSRSPSEPEGVQVKMRSEGGRTYSEVSIVEGREKKHKPSLVLALMKAYGSTCVIAAAYKLIHDILLFVNPILLKFLINFTNNKSEYEWKGYYYATAMLVFAQVQSFVLHQYFHLCMVLGMKLRAALISAVYQKTLTLSNAARKLSTVGEIVNLMSVDAQVFMDSMTYINTIWSAPFQISVCLFFLWQTLGPSVLAGLAVMILLIPLNGVLAAKIKALQAQQMNLKDSRIKLMNEVLNGIKVLKLYAWELSFQDKILATRSKELNILKKSAYLNSFTTFTWMCAPVFVSLTTFAVYVLSDSDNVLSAEKAFVALSLFNLLRFPLIMLPQVVTNVIQLSVSAKRIKNFLSLEELDPQAVKQSSTSENGITIKDGTFLWEKGGPAILKNINLDIPEGSLIAVVGVVGSGKSSLISAILGEMEISQSTITLKGRLAYVTQQAWIQNDTLQNNILFGKTLNKRKYTEILEACALISDLEMLPAGDQTEIGEKGINLSGGQKQRVNLARAIYQDTDIYLLDDPLSAVDSHVGKHIFDHVIGSNGLLAEKVDMIVVLKNGEISERGTYKQLVSCDGAFAEFLKTYLAEQMEESVESLNELILQENDVQEGSESINISKRNISGQEERRITLSFSDVSAFSNESSKADKWQQSQEKMPEQKADDKLVQEESSETGRVKFSVFQTYVKAIGAILVLVTLFFYVAFNAVSVYSNIWLSEWTEDVTRSNGTMTTHQRNMRLGVYGALGLLQGLMIFGAVFFLYVGNIRAGIYLHSSVLTNVLASPMAFFDTTPTGRILNRFSKDINVLDTQLARNFDSWLLCFFRVISVPIVVSYSTPMFMAICLPIAILYIAIQRFYVASSRQLKRIESVSRSPIYSHFGETVTGVSTIRAFGQQSRFIKESESRVDDNNASYYPTLAANRWLAIRLEFMANCIVFFAAVFAVLSRDSLSAGSVGLSITYALSVTQTLNWMVRMTSELETNIVAVERIKEYADSPTEASWVISDKRPDPHWPQKGQVHFQNYATRYREGLDLVIKGIDCQIRSREKVGVVGRTGAGKSSLTMALFRIIEPASGTIFIDDINISEIGLHDLRSKLTIIPQDPVVFSGTLRMNLDPFDCYTDSDIWKALEHAHLKDFVSSLTEQLHYKCSEGGENLSMGQRQLLCLARALLRKTKILILDEATAAVDLETDDLIQQTIRVEFAECTVLTIAHRLNTIMDYSRILVLDAGKICEFDSPANLLKNNKSVFYGMVKAAGLV